MLLYIYWRWKEMDYELIFWIGLVIAALIFVSCGRAIYGPSQTISDEALYRLCK